MSNSALGLYRVLWLGLIASVLFLAGSKMAAWLRAPGMVEGDRTEKRACRQCHGKGSDPDLARELPEVGKQCPFCSGTGKVTVLLPGPNHPVRVVGVLVEESKTSLTDGYANWMVDYTTGTIMSAEPRAGVLEGGRVTFTGTATVDVETGKHGLITAELPPGTYQVTASKDGYEATRAQVVVQPLTEPIWLEHATLVTEPENEAQGRSDNGIQLLVTLAKPGERPGRLIRGLESIPTP